MPTFEELREKHNSFKFEKYSWKLLSDDEKNSGLEIKFLYKIEPDIYFSPTLLVKNVTQKMIDDQGSNSIDTYIFNIGMAEMFSYWKSTASSNIEILAGDLNQEQIEWWHKLLIKGMGEYFFVNNIKFTADDFVKIVSKQNHDSSANQEAVGNQNSTAGQITNALGGNHRAVDRDTKILIPIGGGKDSSVTLEILSNSGNSNSPGSAKGQDIIQVGTFVVSPTQAALDLISAKENSALDDLALKNSVSTDLQSNKLEKIEVKRTIDSGLIDLNNLGYLNGHVPISSFFAFLSVFVADLFGYTHVAISNERSSNEGNVQFCDREINHQYSKTYEFETDFQKYVKKYLPESAPLYFSFLRPLYELQIAKIFSGNSKFTSGMNKYHQVFRSCNRGQKTNSWCGECSKCLFAYVIIHPFVDDEKIHSYFGKDILDDEKLWTIAQELLGVGAKKPLECVGTHEETIVAFYLAAKKYLDKNQKFPALLEKVYQNIIIHETNLENRTSDILNAWNEDNSVPDQFSKLLKKYMAIKENSEVKETDLGHRETKESTLKQKPKKIDNEPQNDSLTQRSELSSNRKLHWGNSDNQKLENFLHTMESKKILILGLGREGLSIYKFLRENFPNKKLFLIDEKKLSELGSDWQKIKENDDNVMFATEIEGLSKGKEFKLNNTDKNKILAIKSPGLSPKNPLILQAQKIKAQFTSSTNIFFELLETINSAKNGDSHLIKTIGVTGTKGKSTTTSMINHVLTDCGFKTFFGGNIGIPPLSLWTKISKVLKDEGETEFIDKPITVILEMSSHQLSDLKFSPSIAVILDISPEHLDYYDSFDEYVQAKSQISRFQTDTDLVIFNDKQKLPTKLANLGNAEQITFNIENNVSNNSIIYRNESIIDLDQLPVIGKHNILNSIPSIIIAKELGCRTADINRSLKTFKTLPHRLEIVSSTNKILYVNDSLSTTPKSCIAAINSFNNSPIILIAGGHIRNLKFDELAKSLLESNIKHLILLPDTGEKILEEIKALEPTYEREISFTLVGDMKEAVAVAKSFAVSGDVVLLSPAAASFGHFKDYQDRGDQFKKFVLYSK